MALGVAAGITMILASILHNNPISFLETPEKPLYRLLKHCGAAAVACPIQQVHLVPGYQVNTSTTIKMTLLLINIKLSIVNCFLIVAGTLLGLC